MNIFVFDFKKWQAFSKVVLIRDKKVHPKEIYMCNHKQMIYRIKKKFNPLGSNIKILSIPLNITSSKSAVYDSCF